MTVFFNSIPNLLIARVVLLLETSHTNLKPSLFGRMLGGYMKTSASFALGCGLVRGEVTQQPAILLPMAQRIGVV